MARIERILIVGGGIAGLTLATALHQQGFRPELIERDPSWQAIGAGIAVQPNGMRILHTLGMGSAVERAGAAIRYWDFCDQQGAVLSQTDLEALWGMWGLSLASHVRNCTRCCRRLPLRCRLVLVYR